MTRLATVGALVLALPSLAFAHVSVRPRESKPAVEERYTVRVPTEGTVATTHVSHDHIDRQQALGLYGAMLIEPREVDPGLQADHE